MIKKALAPLNLLTKMILIIAIIIMSAMGALLLRLNQGPLNLDFAKQKIEQTLSSSTGNYTIKIGRASLIWPEVSAPLLINVDDFQVLQSQENKTNYAVNIDSVSFSLSALALLKAQLRPARIIVMEPYFQALNDKGDFNSFWQKNNSAEIYGPVKPINIKDNIRDVLKQITNNDGQNFKILENLTKISVIDAHLHDAKNNNLAVLNLNLEKNKLGLSGDLDVRYPEKSGKKAHFKSDLLYRKAEADLTLTATLKNLHSAHVAPFFKDFKVLNAQDLFLNGTAKIALDEELNLQFGNLNLNVPKGKLSFPTFYDEAFPINDMMADISYNRAAKTLDLNAMTMGVADIPIDFKFKGQLEKNKFTAPITFTIPKTSPENLANLIPDTHQDSPVQQWITKRLSDGTLSNTTLNTELVVIKNLQSQAFDLVINQPKLTFDFADMSVRYHNTLTPVKQASGSGVYYKDMLTINSNRSQVGEITGRDVTVKITDLSIKSRGQADIKINAAGPFQSALRYISDKPISASQALGFDIDAVKGNVDFDLVLNFPTIKNLPKEDVKVTMNGTVTDLFLPNIVRGQNLTGGPFHLSLADQMITLKGNGKLSDNPINLLWQQSLTKQGAFDKKITVNVTANKALRQAFDVKMDDFIAGDLPVTATYIEKNNNASMDITADLTPVTLAIEDLDFIKPANVGGSLSFTAHVKGEALSRIENLKLTTENLSIANGNINFGNTTKGKLTGVKLDRSEFSADFEQKNDGLNINIIGKTIDAIPFLKRGANRRKKAPNETAQNMRITIQAAQLYGVDDTILTNSNLTLMLDQAGDPTQIDMRAGVQDGNMLLMFKPDAADKRNFRLETNNAGYLLQFLGVYKNMRGGNLIVVGNPHANSALSDLFGTANIQDFRIVGAPALAKLISAMSLNGVNNLLLNEGVVFTQLKSDFEWQFRDDGNLLVIKEGRTAGNSLGLTFEGLINMGSNMTDISGTIVPISGLNNVVGNIPVIGDILTGGDALIAATYKMKGDRSDPKVTVNPLSVLAPGFLRKIFFEDDIDAKIKKEGTESTTVDTEENTGAFND